MKLKLTDMLKFRRPNGSKTERRFIAEFLDSVPGMQSDRIGNRWLRIGKNPHTMISCHTDTVHTEGGIQEIAQHGSIVSLSVKAQKQADRFKAGKNWRYRDCLGADDGAGMYAALRMIAAKVPALYVFHRAEEVGGKGSSWLSMNQNGFLEDIYRCIALDRRGQEDIITHQMMGRCCSDAFADALADALAMNHGPCQWGTFTDSANYTDIIGECTNVSVGYQFEHTAKEYIDIGYLEALIDRLCSIDFEELPTLRYPGESDYYEPRKSARGYLDKWIAGNDSWEDDDIDGRTNILDYRNTDTLKGNL